MRAALSDSLSRLKQDITGKTPLKLATVWECKRLIWKRYMEVTLALHRMS
jgi:hypothetical protein